MDSKKAYNIFKSLNCFKYFRVTLSNDCICNAAIHIRIATVRATMARLERVWKSNINFHANFKPYITGRAWNLDISGWCRKKDQYRSRTHTWESSSSSTGRPKPIPFYGAMSKILWRDRNISLPLISVRKCHVTRYNSLCQTVRQCTVEGGRQQKRQRKRWSERSKNGRT